MKRKMSNLEKSQGKDVLIDRIRRQSEYSSVSVVNFIQMLCHTGIETNELKSVLLPLLDNDDKAVACAALSALCCIPGENKLISERIIEFASGKNGVAENHSELQFVAIYNLKILYQESQIGLAELINIAESYPEINVDPDEFGYGTSNNCAAWEFLAEMFNLKLSTKEKHDLSYRFHDETAEKVRNRVREAMQKGLKEVPPPRKKYIKKNKRQI